MREGCSLARTVKGVSPPTAPGFGLICSSQQTGGVGGGETPSDSESSERLSIDPLVIESELSDIINRAIASGSRLGGNEFHTRVQRNVANSAKRHGVIGAREYPVTYSDVNRAGKRLEVYGLIDVVWHYGTELVAAVEIDSCYRRKSALKLMASGAVHKFWILYGNISVDNLWEVDSSINIIYYPRKPR